MVPLNQNPIKLDKQQGKLRRNKNHKPEDVDDKSVPTATENSNQKDLPTSSMQPCSKSAIGPESKTLPDIDQVEESDEELSSMNDDNSIQSRVEDMDLEQVFQDFQSIFSRAHDLCREHTPQSIPSLEWWNHHPNKASELSTVLSSNSKPPLKFEELRAYTIDQLGRAYVCGKIVCYLFPNSEPDRYLLSTGGRIEPKDFWTDRQTAEYLGCLEAKIYRLNAGRPHTLAKAERWRSQTVTLLSPIVADNEADLSPDGKLFAEELFKLYVQFIGIHSTADNGAVLEDFERMISQAIKVSRQLRQHHWKFIVRYPQNFSCGHTFRNFRIMGDVNAVDHRILETVNEQIEPPMGPIQYNPDDARTWIIDRPLLLQLRPNIKGKDGTMLRPPLVHVKARLLAAKG
ncbi:uncharacterized protein DFL_002075 [Arthrobotrys flagrans]|uniref:Uncharacterized protein n=1 Tax=Arthrobotrys flagrans TaxID=97331 RepID=A0A437A9T0_ARTFL|nr:hypothetical protein DFL_002075 [Arthrobotrys flagrans]